MTIRIGQIEWVGSVEIHIYASGWLDHHHNTDAAYDNVVLHVVWKNDKAVSRADGSEMPTLELQHRVDESLLLHYKTLFHNPEAIPCAPSLNGVLNISKLSMLDKVMAERLEVKASVILKMFRRNNNDWEETCYQAIFRNFGFKVNAEPFHQLSQSISYKFLLKHADQLTQVEAMLYGQAGFLEEKNEEEYYCKLQREYKLLGQKYQLTGKKVNKVQWRFLRLRPANFPTIRIAQFAALIFHRGTCFPHRSTSRASLQAFFLLASPNTGCTTIIFQGIKEKSTPWKKRQWTNFLSIGGALDRAYGKQRMTRATRPGHSILKSHAESI